MTEQEARAEAILKPLAKRHKAKTSVGYVEESYVEYWPAVKVVAGLLASRSPEAAPSDTDRETLARIITDMMPNVPLCCSGAAFKSEGHDQDPPCLTVIRGREIADAVLASRTSQPVQVEPEGCEHCKSCGSRMWAGQLIRRNDSGRAVEHQNCDHPYHPAAEPVQVEVTAAAELDALNLDAVVVDRAGVPRTKRAGNSHMPGGWTHGGNSPLTSTELADGNPMTVVYAGRGLLSHPAALGGGE